MPNPDPAAEQILPVDKNLQTSRKIRLIRIEKIAPAFWTVASIISLLVNITLIVIIILLSRQLFSLKQLVQEQLIGGLYSNFIKMDQSHIRTTIPIDTEVPAKFDLPLNTTTMVTLTEDTVIPKATIYDLDAGALRISKAKTNIILPAGSKLPVQLNLTVPVDQKIPVKLMVDVDIPLNQTELHIPFTGLRGVIEPYYSMLTQMPKTWQEAICGPQPSGFCPQIIPNER
jgi:hypothetical protein